jgi:hypothetical protein
MLIEMMRRNILLVIHRVLVVEGAIGIDVDIFLIFILVIVT